MKKDHCMTHFLSEANSNFWRTAFQDPPFCSSTGKSAIQESSVRHTQSNYQGKEIFFFYKKLNNFEILSFYHFGRKYVYSYSETCQSFSVNWQNSARSRTISSQKAAVLILWSSYNPCSRTLLSSPRRSLQDFWGFLLNWLENIE